MRKIRRRRLRWIALGMLPFGALVLAFQVLPLLYMAMTSLLSDDESHYTFAQYNTVLTSPFYLQAIRNSLLIASVSAAAGLVLGLFMARALTRVSPPVRDKLLTLSNMTSNFAGVPLAFAYIILLGNNGVFTLLLHRWGLDPWAPDLYSWTGLVIVYVYFQVPLSAMLLYPVLTGIRSAWQESASLLGAGSWTFWRRIGLPYVLPGAAGTFVLLFSNAMGAYATAYALVGGNYNLVATRISSLIAGDVFSRPQLGCAMAVLLGLAMTGALALNHWLIGRTRRIAG